MPIFGPVKSEIDNQANKKLKLNSELRRREIKEVIFGQFSLIRLFQIPFLNKK